MSLMSIPDTTHTKKKKKKKKKKKQVGSTLNKIIYIKIPFSRILRAMALTMSLHLSPAKFQLPVTSRNTLLIVNIFSASKGQMD